MSNPFDQTGLMAKLADAITVKDEMANRVADADRETRDWSRCRYPDANARMKQVSLMVAKEEEWKKLLKQATAVVDNLIDELLVPLVKKANSFGKRRLRKGE